MAERGRPSLYTEELAERICERLAAGETLRAICRDDGMPGIQTVLDWKARNAAFSGQYETARVTGYQLMADELTEIADDKLGEPQRDRLRIDTRKWLLSKALPKVYGDRQTHEIELGANERLLSLIEAGLTRANQR